MTEPLDRAARHQAPDHPVAVIRESRAWLSWRQVVAALVILLFGWVRLAPESRLTRENHAASFGNTQLNLALRDKVGQLGFLAALSGFRTLLADVLWIEAHVEWERHEYGRMNLLLGTVTTLAPRNATFWELSSWHMAFNASVAVMEDRKEPKLAVRLKAQHEYFILGKDYLERGIANNPDSYSLHQALGLLYKEKLYDHCAASAEYTKAAACPRAPGYEKRFAAYEMSKCPGHEREAWKMLRTIYDMGEQEHLPSILTWLKAMEEKLQLPAEQRVYKNP